MTLTELRSRIYEVFDEVLATGVPVEVERNGRRLKIVAVDPPPKLDNLKPHPDYLRCDSDELVHLDWSAEWKEST
jgi:Antitoxin Phd_YefM, type II toxin-antitoxin system